MQFQPHTRSILLGFPHLQRMEITVNQCFRRDNCESCDNRDWRRERLISFGAYLHRMRVTTHSLKENHMKRLPQTLTAAALTGALAFGGAAVA